MRTWIIAGIVAGLLGVGGCKKKPQDKPADSNQPNQPVHLSQEELRDTAEEILANQVARPLTEEMTKLFGTANIDDAAQWGSTPLHAAVTMGKLDKVRELIKNGADVNARDEDGRTPLHLAAARWEDNGMVAELLAAGAKVNAQDIYGQTPLYLVTVSNLKWPLPVLLKAGADANIADKEGITPLHVAGRDGHIGDARTLLAGGAKVNAKDNDGWTALHYAAANNEKMIVKTLIDAGADTSAQNNAGWTPLGLAADKTCWGAFNALTLEGVKEPTWTPLHMAAIRRDDAAAKKALSKKADVNATDRFGRTPLHWAATSDGNDIARLLIAAGAKIDAEDAEKRTPLHLAARSNRAAVAKQLIAAKANVKARDDIGGTPLHYAAANTNTEAITALLAAGAEIDARARDGETPLLVLIDRCQGSMFVEKRPETRKAFALLLNAGADGTIRDNHGQPDDSFLRDIPDEAAARIRRQMAQKRLALIDKLLAQYGPAGSGPKPASIEPTTPAETLRRMTAAVYGGNADVWQSCFTGTDEQLALTKAIYENQRAYLAFRKTMIDTCGRDAWLTFQQTGAFSVNMIGADDDKLRNLACRMEGDKAYYREGSDEMMLQKKQGQWHIVAASLIPPNARTADLTRFYHAMTDMLTRYQRKIRPNINPAEFNQQMGHEMFGILMHPPR